MTLILLCLSSALNIVLFICWSISMRDYRRAGFMLGHQVKHDVELTKKIHATYLEGLKNEPAEHSSVRYGDSEPD